MGIVRSVLLAGSESRWLRERAPRYGFVRNAVSRFMPGETVEAALEATRSLGLGTVLTQLGENVRDLEAARGVTRHYLGVLERARQSGLDVEISVKLTQLGLDLSREECEKNLLTLIERARALSRWIWIDIESTAYTDRTLDIYRRMLAAYPQVGVCVQAYLYPTAAELKALLSVC